ncbi:MAG: YkgJ family cysteine cluster protein, partial [Porticoccaceae bacterium]|nr:YkgJ family cysteine cluster protein [Porticoccaceae bacterium]
MPPFWESKTLSQMNDSEWELLCDGCAKCCLVKLEDRDTGEIFHTNVTCKLLDINTCECSQYQQRHSIVND